MDERAGAKPFSECGVLIAGGTSGVGLASAIGFAREGVRGIVLLGRNPERGAQAVTSVLAAVPSASVSFISADACRSEEHTSELQSLMRISYAVFCLKKKHTIK